MSNKDILVKQGSSFVPLSGSKVSSGGFKEAVPQLYLNDQWEPFPFEEPEPSIDLNINNGSCLIDINNIPSEAWSKISEGYQVNLQLIRYHSRSKRFNIDNNDNRPQDLTTRSLRAPTYPGYINSGSMGTNTTHQYKTRLNITEEITSKTTTDISITSWLDSMLEALFSFSNKMQQNYIANASLYHNGYWYQRFELGILLDNEILFKSVKVEARISQNYLSSVSSNYTLSSNNILELE